MRRGRPRSVNDEVVAALLRFGVKPGVVAVAFGVHPKTVERSKRRYDQDVQPTIEALRSTFRDAMKHVFMCAEGGHECETCAGFWKLAHQEAK